MNRRLVVLLLVFLLLFSSAPLALAQTDCDFSISNYARAVQLHDMGDYGRALQHYDCALLEDPDSPVIPLLIDNVHEDIASAGKAWAPPAQPVCDPARDQKALSAAAFERGDNRAALVHLDCVLQAAPTDVATLTLMGRIQADLGDAHAARHYLYRAHAALAAAPARGEDVKSPARFEMPDWLTPYETVPRQSARRTSGYNPAATLAQTPDSGRVYVVVLGPRIEARAGDGGLDARRLARRTSEQQAPALSRSSDPAAEAFAAVAAEPASPAQSTFERGLELLSARKRYAAANTMLTALEIDPDHRAARCQLGVIWTDWSNYSGALAQFDRLLATDPEDECARQNRKIAVMRMLAMYVPLTVDDFFFHARTFVQVEEWELARDALISGLERDPARKDARCQLGMIYSTLGDDRAALREFDHVLTHDAIDPCARSNREALLQRLRAER